MRTSTTRRCGYASAPSSSTRPASDLIQTRPDGTSVRRKPPSRPRLRIPRRRYAGTVFSEPYQLLDSTLISSIYLSLSVLSHAAATLDLSYLRQGPYPSIPSPKAPPPYPVRQLIRTYKHMFAPWSTQSTSSPLKVQLSGGKKKQKKSGPADVS